REAKRVIGDDSNKVREFEKLPGRIFSARFSADGSRIVVGSSSEGKGEVRVYEAGPSTLPTPLLVLQALPGTTGALAGEKLFPPPRPAKLAPVSKFEGQQGPVYAVAFRPDGQQAASAGFDGVVRLNEPQTGKLIKEFSAVPLATAGK